MKKENKKKTENIKKRPKVFMPVKKWKMSKKSAKEITNPDIKGIKNLINNTIHHLKRLKSIHPRDLFTQSSVGHEFFIFT